MTDTHYPHLSQMVGLLYNAVTINETFLNETRWTILDYQKFHYFDHIRAKFRQKDSDQFDEDAVKQYLERTLGKEKVYFVFYQVPV